MSEARPSSEIYDQPLSPYDALNFVKVELAEAGTETRHERLQSIAFSAAVVGAWHEFEDHFGEYEVYDQLNGLSEHSRSDFAAKLALGGYKSHAEGILRTIKDPEVSIKTRLMMAENYAIRSEVDDAKEHLRVVYGEDRKFLANVLFTIFELSGDYQEADSIRKTEDVEIKRMLQSAACAAEECDEGRFDEIISFAIRNFSRQKWEKEGSVASKALRETIIEHVVQSTLSDPDNTKQDTLNSYNSALHLEYDFKWPKEMVDKDELRQWIYEGHVEALLRSEQIGYALEVVCRNSGIDADMKLLEAAEADDWDAVSEVMYGASDEALRTLLRYAQLEDNDEAMLAIAEELLISKSSEPELDDLDKTLEVIGEVAVTEGVEYDDWETAKKLFKTSKYLANTNQGLEIIDGIINCYNDQPRIDSDDDNVVIDTLYEIIDHSERLFRHAHTVLDGFGYFEEADRLREYFTELDPAVFVSDTLDSRVNIAVELHEDWGLAIKTAVEINELNESVDGHKILAVEALKYLSAQKNKV